MKANITPISRTFWSKSGLAAARPAATGLRNGSIWFSTDTLDIDQVQAGAWATILDYSALTGSVLTTRGDILKRGVSADERLAKGTDGQHLKMGANEPAWGDMAIEWGKLTVTEFQRRPAFGTFAAAPPNLNDNNVTSYSGGNSVGQYGEVAFLAPMKITQWRQYGDAGQNNDGVWKIQYLNSSGVWTDWVTGIPTRATESWTGWDSGGGEVVATAIRLVIVTLDSSGMSQLNELEVKY